MSESIYTILLSQEHFSVSCRTGKHLFTEILQVRGLPFKPPWKQGIRSFVDVLDISWWGSTGRTCWDLIIWVTDSVSLSIWGMNCVAWQPFPMTMTFFAFRFIEWFQWLECHMSPWNVSIPVISLKIAAYRNLTDEGKGEGSGKGRKGEKKREWSSGERMG